VKKKKSPKTFIKLVNRLKNPYFWDAFKVQHKTQKRAAKALNISTGTYRKIAKNPNDITDRTFLKIKRKLDALTPLAKRRLTRTENVLPLMTRFEEKKLFKLARDAAKFPHGTGGKKRTAASFTSALDKALKIHEVESGSLILARLNTVADALGLPRVTKSPSKSKKEIEKETLAEKLANEEMSTEMLDFEDESLLTNRWFTKEND